MTRAPLLRQRLSTLFLAGLAMLFSPLVLRFESLGNWLGVPLLYLYLFVTWGAVIGVAAWIVSRSRD